MTHAVQGLYLILDAQWESTRSLAQILEEAADGVTVVQYRNKTDSLKRAYAHARALREIASGLGIRFIVNDRCDLALAVEADGVHVGQADLPLELARKVMGPHRLIGLSTHRAEEVIAAEKAGADYIGFGPIFPTATKPDHEQVVGVEGLRRIRHLTSLPIVAIGGITPETAPDIVAAGANGIAVASAILDAPNIPQVVKALSRPFR